MIKKVHAIKRLYAFAKNFARSKALGDSKIKTALGRGKGHAGAVSSI